MTRRVPDRYDGFVGGEWQPSDDAFDVTDPATNERITRVAEAGPGGVDAALRSSTEALPGWRALDPKERGQILRDVADAIEGHVDRLAYLETIEGGRPLRHSSMLVSDAAAYFEYYAGLVNKIEGETIPLPGERLNYTICEPLGVTAHVVPWNAQTLLAARSVAPALACGNTAIVKPAPEAPLALLEFAQVATDAGLPPGVLNVVPGDGPGTGAALTGDDRLDGIAFTGSRETGRTVMKAAADSIVPVSLELGGNAPCVVFDDADVERAVGHLQRVFFNAGQVCFAPRRLFVHESRYDTVVDGLVAAAEELTIGHGLDDPDVGPLIRPEAREQVARAVDEAVEGGATVLTGGKIPREEGNFYEPTILENVDPETSIACEEVFGPVLAVYPFDDEKTVLERANDVDFGLYAVVYTENLSRAHRAARELEAGTVAINEYPLTFPNSPFGGYKESGIGREKGLQAIEHYTQRKSVIVSLDE